MREPIAAAGSADILVIGTTNDPATPYVWAQTLAERARERAPHHLHGEGHTAYNKSNSCVNDAVDDYFIDGRVPEPTRSC